MTLLEGTGITKDFGGVRALDACSLDVQEGSITGLIGPNGSGKTTLFNVITGYEAVDQGQIRFKGETITNLKPDSIFSFGIARTFQNIRLFPNLTVLDNVRIAYHTHAGYSMADGILHNRHFGQKERELTEKAQEFLAVFNLQDRQGEIAKNLPYGEQRRLEMARAFVSQPILTLLDEPVAGLNPEERR